MHGRPLIPLAVALGLLGPMAARADQPSGTSVPDPSTIITGQVENDSISGTDRYYTSGVRLGVTLPTGQLPGFVHDAGQWLWGDGQQRLAFDLTQSIFTPRVTQAAQPDPRDRPYAAILLGTTSLIHDSDNTRNIVSLGLGAIGPAALGEEAQNGVHHIIGAKSAKGWASQLPGQAVVQITADRIWRVPITPRDGALEMDVLPEVTAGVGTWRVYGQAGAQVRIGQGLDADFGVARIRPGLSGGDAFNTSRGLAWYVFAGVDGQAVAWDETLDGEPFTSTRHVTRTPLVAEVQAGVVVMIANGIRASFTQVYQTHEFVGQHRRLFGFSSAALSVKF